MNDPHHTHSGHGTAQGQHDHHHHGGGHSHRHLHVDPEAGDRRVALAVAVNLGLTVVQIIGGIVSGSLALIADALHNFSDAVSLIIAFGARRVARRPASKEMTFGWGRAEVVAALINYTTLILVGLYLVWEAVARFVAPEPVAGWTVVWVAAVALIVDAVTAALTFSMSRTSVNLRAAFLHNLADALGSVAVILTGIVILLWDWRLADPLATLGIAAYVLWQSAREIVPVIRILMLGAPPGIDPAEVVAEVRGVDGVEDVHHVHLWQMQEHEAALDAHLVVSGDWQAAEAAKAEVKRRLGARFGIGHVTLDLEAREICSETKLYGHG